MGNWKTGGGGFLNGVDGVIAGYAFESKDWPAKKKGGEGYTTLSAELLVLQDGAKEPVKQFLQAGFLHDDVTISDDGLTLESENDAPIILGDSDFAKFIDSLEAPASGDLKFTAFEGTEYRNFEAMVGTRVTFKKVVDVEATEKFGKRVAKTGKSKGKEFNRDFLAVERILALPDGKKAKKVAKPATGKKTPPPVEADDDAPDAKGALLAMLKEAKGKTIAVAQLSSAAVKYALSNDIEGDDREALREAVIDTDFLATEDGWVLDKKSKSVVLA